MFRAHQSFALILFFLISGLLPAQLTLYPTGPITHTTTVHPIIPAQFLAKAALNHLQGHRLLGLDPVSQLTEGGSVSLLVGHAFDHPVLGILIAGHQ